MKLFNFKFEVKCYVCRSFNKRRITNCIFMEVHIPQQIQRSKLGCTTYPELISHVTRPEMKKHYYNNLLISTA
ncbi:hypothetical protein TSUD_08400 [Trifolium subterraneum]|nr:hypothetical protein TSUD_08400 [Trifolium subterraneum]